MLKALTLFLLFQLIGEAAARALLLPVPGPVVGMALLLAALLLRYRGRSDRAPAWLTGTADGLLGHLSLLFVPASVGLIQHVGRLETEWPAVVAALVVSTVLAIAVGALTFLAVARLAGARARGEEVKGREDGGSTGHET